MPEPEWKYVVHATRQGWLVDMFEEQGKIPATVERIESEACPRGKVFLLPDLEHHLNALKAEPLWPDTAKEFVQTWHDREMDRLLAEIVNRPVPVPTSLVKIESIP